MAKKLFKGFRQELEGQFTAEDGYLYFVRNEANTGKTDGYILFNGKRYGTSAEATTRLEALIGEFPSGFSSISEWIESNERVSAEALTNLDERVSANTEAIQAISGIAGDFATKTEVGTLSGRVDVLETSAATKTEVGTLSGRVDALSAVSADSRISAIESDYLNSTDKNALEGEIGTVSGRVDTLSSVTSAHTEFITNSAATKEALGELSGVVENNASFIANSAATKTEVGTLSGRVDALSAVSAETRITTLEQGVQLVEEGDSSVSVSAISGGTQTVSVNISNADNNALELDKTNGGLFAAIYYDGEDSDNE